VSPENLLVSYEGAIKLADFGIAKATDRETRTNTGVIKGKLNYLAPEQVVGQPADQSVDIYAAGAVLYELLAGRPLRDGQTPGTVLTQASEGAYTPLRTLGLSMPARAEEVVDRALQPQPSRRYQDAAALQQDLESVMVEEGWTWTPLQTAALLKELFPREMESEAEAMRNLMLRVGTSALDAPPLRAARPAPDDADTQPINVPPVRRTRAQDPEARGWDAATRVEVSPHAQHATGPVDENGFVTQKGPHDAAEEPPTEELEENVVAPVHARTMNIAVLGGLGLDGARPPPRAQRPVVTPDAQEEEAGEPSAPGPVVQQERTGTAMILQRAGLQRRQVPAAAWGAGVLVVGLLGGWLMRGPNAPAAPAVTTSTMVDTQGLLKATRQTHAEESLDARQRKQRVAQLLEEGTRALNDGNPALAADKARQALDLDEDNARAMQLMGKASVTSRKEARKALDGARNALFASDMPLAIQRAEQALLLDPALHEAHLVLGTAHAQLGRICVARKHYEKLMETRPAGVALETVEEALKKPEFLSCP
jgi:hypothetical protein